MSREEITRLRQYCGKATPDEQIMILGLCLEVDEQIADDIYIHLRTEISYDRLNNIRYVPASKRSFYERCDKVLSKLRQYLVNEGKWE